MLDRLPDRRSRALGTPGAGRLRGGVRFPATGPDHLTWDPITKARPSRPWRRVGTARAVRRTLGALHALRRARPGLGRLLVGDLSRPRGGDFGARFGILGHQTHQNGRDVDIYWPLRDGRSAVATRGDQVDQAAARALVRALLAAGAGQVLVGPAVRVRGARVRVVAGHDDHVHATF
jgi:murein endopeptidase